MYFYLKTQLLIVLIYHTLHIYRALWTFIPSW